MTAVIDRASALACWHGVPTRMPMAHRHDDVELNWCTSSRLVYLFGGHRFVVEPPAVAAFWAAAPHQLIDLGPDTRVSRLTIPLPMLLRWELPERFVRALLTQRPLRWDMRSGPPFDQWAEDLTSGSEYLRATAVLEIRALLRRLTLRTPGGSAGATAGADDLATAHATRMARFIAEHFIRPLRVDDVAAAAHLSRQYAMAVFHRVVGITMTDYLNRCRVAEAQRLLIATDLPTTEVGARAGFGSPSQFYAVFGQQCGYPPASYRRLIRRGG